MSNNQNNNLPVAANNETAVGFVNAGANLAELLSDELNGLTLSFDRIHVPGAGGTAWDVPGDNPDSPDTVKEIKAVILYHHPVHVFYKEKYTGGNAAPDCGSLNGHTGTESESGEVHLCKDCPRNKFGSAEDGNAKACKQKRRIYILREGENLPLILTLPVGSLAEFSKYVVRLLSKGLKSSGVVTKFTLKKAQNSGGIAYSQVVATTDRALNSQEQVSVDRMAEQVKRFAQKVDAAETDADGE